MSALLSIQDLTVSYGEREVVHGISLNVHRGRRTALVGESGSGKSVTARAVLQLDASARIGGSVRLAGTEPAGTEPAGTEPAGTEPAGTEPAGTELVGASGRALRAVRGSRVGLVFQDPLTSLNPVMTIGWQIMQPLVIRGMKKRQARARGIELLGRLGVKDAAGRFDDYPHQFSGGMRQRVVIAIAVIAEPELLIADEPTTALDVRVQAQVLDLLHEVAAERDMAVLLITHDLGVVAGFADDVVVMRHGRIVETADVQTLFADPRHPYTRGLLGAVPRLDRDPAQRLVSVEEIEASVAAGQEESR